jgi:pyrroline-5-carboxylate reductase
MRLAVIGVGKMGRAIVAGLLSRKILAPRDVIGVSQSEKSGAAFLALAPEGELRWTPSIAEAAQEADVLLLGVKPYQMESLLPQVSSAAGRALFLSIAAGLRLSFYEKRLGSYCRVIRAMPNTPVALGQGVTAYTPNQACSSLDLEWVETIFTSVGTCYRVNEDQLNTITALSGSGPAFVYRIIEALANAATEAGLPMEQALPITAQTLIGASRMIQESGMTPEQLVQQVVSKGGTTEAGLQVLENSSLQQILRQTIRAASQRSEELSRNKD